MKTNELLNADEAALVPQLRAMKIKELERHATKLLKKFGAEYAPVLAAVTKTIPRIRETEQEKTDQKKAGQEAFERVQAVIRSQALAPDNEMGMHITQRIAVIMMVIIKKQFLKIHNGG